MVQLSHPYMTIGKTVALTRWTFVGKALSLLFNMLSVLIFCVCHSFLSKCCLLISWLQSLSAGILESTKIKYVIFSPSVCHEVVGLDVMILVFYETAKETLMYRTEC